MTTTLTTTHTDSGDRSWRPLYRLGAVVALVQLAMIPVAMAVFFAWPPQKTAAELFALFHENALRGLLALDLIYMATIVLTGLLLVALCMSLRRAAPTLSLLGATLGLLSTAMYFPSNTAFEMWNLSVRFAAATTEAERTALLGAGNAMLAIYQGSTFTVSYVMAAVAGLLIAAAMWQSRVYGRGTAALGLVANTLGLIPSNAGTIGMVAAIAFLIPYVLWLPLVARRLLQLGRGTPLVLPPRATRSTALRHAVPA